MENFRALKISDLENFRALKASNLAMGTTSHLWKGLALNSGEDFIMSKVQVGIQLEGYYQHTREETY